MPKEMVKAEPRDNRTAGIDSDNSTMFTLLSIYKDIVICIYLNHCVFILRM